MSSIRSYLTMLLAAVVLLMPLGSMSKAGQLDPPGTPAQTMRTLDQVEARTPVQTLPGSSSASHVISQPGSYYLTGNIQGQSGKNGIEIAADNVTLDLNGFALIGVTGSGTGIVAPSGAQDIQIEAGGVREWQNGAIDLSQAHNCIIRDIRLQANSSAALYGHALVVGPSSLIERCVAEGNTVNRAIQVGSGCTVRDCVVTATANGGTGFYLEDNNSLATDCVSSQNSGDGFTFSSRCRLENCVAAENGGFGFASGGAFNVIRGCSITRNQDGGVILGDVNTVESSFIAGNRNVGGTAAGITLGNLTANNRIDGNTILSNDIGLSIGNAPSGGGHLIIRNILGGNTTDQTIGSGNAFGQFINVGESGSFASTDPNANLIY